jgi:hypothetical protein
VRRRHRRGLAVLVGAGALWPTGDPTGRHRSHRRGPGRRSAGHPLHEPRTVRGVPAPPRRDPELSADDDLDLVVWPENAINVDGSLRRQHVGPGARAGGRRLDARSSSASSRTPPTSPDAFLNYVLVVEPDGTLEERYDKVRRVPFGEYVPMRPLFEPLAGRRAAAPGPGSRRRCGGHRHPVGRDGRGDQLGDLLLEASPRRRARGRRDRAQPDERVELLAHPGADPAAGDVSAAGGRERTVDRPGRTHRVLRGVRRERHRAPGPRSAKKRCSSRTSPASPGPRRRRRSATCPPRARAVRVRPCSSRRLDPPDGDAPWTRSRRPTTQSDAI